MRTWKTPKMRLMVGSLWSLTIASIKMYFRNKSAVFFTLFIPVAFVAVFGLLSQSGATKFNLDVTNNSTSPIAAEVMTALKKVDAFKITEVKESVAATDLGKGKIDLQVIIPADFGQIKGGQISPAKIITHYNAGKPQNGQAASLVLGQIVSGINAQIAHVPQTVSLSSSGVKTNNLGAIDFLLPGILAMSIMQLGIFSVAFAFVSYKTTGALRRLQATPTHPINFVFGQAITRLIIGMIQVVLLLALGAWFFGFHMIGSVAEFLLVALLGTIVFLAFGFMVAGYAKDENQAAPIANLISFPMMFLSGVFFARDAFPEWLRIVTDYLPLTYLADALRRIANEGASLLAVGGDLLGLAVWGIVMFFVSVKVFSWE